MGGATSFNPFQTLPLFLILITPLIGATLPFATVKDAAAAATSPPPVLSTNKNSPSSVPFKPSTSVLVGALTATFSLTFLFLIYIKHCHDGNNFAVDQNPRRSHVRKNSGIDHDVLEALPIFRFGSLKGEKNGLDCAVCLSRFEDPEVLRLLPKCKHAFHVECVDTWLDAHSTCPLCRYKVEPEDDVVENHDARAKSSEEELDLERGQNDDAENENENAGTTSLDSAGHRLEHRIIVSPRGGVHQRWSDFEPRDVLYLRSEMVTWKARGGGGRRRRSDGNSNVVGEVMENGGVMKNFRSVSEVTGMRSVQSLLLFF